MIRGILDSGKYKGKKFIADNEDQMIILVQKGVFANGSEMYAKFDRRKDDYISDNEQ